ncbi:PHD finger protein At1g33420 [Ricinus communis]|uniref:DNA binding protein, putative n=1 Tax=Ricinus communis TaxID=3988 RepID=B9S1T6_RICCO|nr:PHD finger protein At1g33420 [Ricinus communis]EEF42555.1 DNA binding protein, putative [Ricinus communis]|eukprot:XP_002519951.1 PHD finger protein At1g33420 [Ricinus communis]
MVVNDRPLKRPKRNRVTANLYDFFTFPEAAVADEERPFRDNIKHFLSRHARVTYPPPLFPCLLTWQIVFRVGDLVEEPDLSPVVVLLDIVEEDVTRTTTATRSAYCNQCRVIGWSEHPVCTKRYHFMIRATSSSSSSKCTKCNNLLDLSDSRCKWCHSAPSSDDIDEWICSQFEDNSHLLHGVVHSNGFGHLLRVNGREGGSDILTGYHIMDFWDRLCATLRVRKVSVMDVSRKYGIEYRLLCAITKGHSWYGDWGYEFGRGSYALTSDSYNEAVKTISNVPLAPILFQRRRPRTHLQAVIAFYQSLSDLEVLTLKDLCSFMLRLIHQTNESLLPKATLKKIRSSTSNVLCAWTRNDVECVQQAMIRVLVAASGENNWVSRHALKGVMCKRASPELLDYCLKYLGGKLAANSMVVQARCNPNTCDAEYRLAPLSFMHCGDRLDKVYPSKEDIKCDLKFLLDSLLDRETTVNYGPHVTRESVIDAATKLLDCKQFVKDYRPKKMVVNNPVSINIMCHVELSEQPKDDPAIPPELIILPLNATVADLKREASKAFQEVYAMFRRFEAQELPEYGCLEDSVTLKFLVGTSGSVKIKGTCPSKQTLSHFRMERGMERWTVDCPCGAKDDDGEKMLACDTCGVWQHTRCAGIDNSDTIPSMFVCLRCMNARRRECKRKEEVPCQSITTSSTCRGEAVPTGSVVGVTFSVP